MNALITSLRMLVRLFGTALLVLGLIIWSGHGSLVTIHIQLGFALMAALLALVIVGAMRRIGVAPLVLGVVWILLLPMVGFAQLKWLPGSSHWIIQVVHLLLGIGAIGIGEVIGARAGRAGNVPAR